jgi:hypothetical protein
MLDDDVQLDPQRLRIAFDADPFAAQDAPDARAGGQPDDAVTGESRRSDDLGDRIAGDREATVLEVESEVIRHGAD